MSIHRATNELRQFSKAIIQVLGKDALNGCTTKDWMDFENGNGTKVGPKIQALIKRAKRNLNRFNIDGTKNKIAKQQKK